MQVILKNGTAFYVDQEVANNIDTQMTFCIKHEVDSVTTVKINGNLITSVRASEVAAIIEDYQLNI